MPRSVRLSRLVPGLLLVCSDREYQRHRNECQPECGNEGSGLNATQVENGNNCHTSNVIYVQLIQSSVCQACTSTLDSMDGKLFWGNITDCRTIKSQGKRDTPSSKLTIII